MIWSSYHLLENAVVFLHGQINATTCYGHYAQIRPPNSLLASCDGMDWVNSKSWLSLEFDIAAKFIKKELFAEPVQNIGLFCGDIVTNNKFLFFGTEERMCGFLEQSKEQVSSSVAEDVDSFHKGGQELFY